MSYLLTKETVFSADYFRVIMGLSRIHNPSVAKETPLKIFHLLKMDQVLRSLLRIQPYPMVTPSADKLSRLLKVSRPVRMSHLSILVSIFHETFRSCPP